MDESHVLVGGTVLFTIVMIVFSLLVTIVPIVLVFRWLGKMKAQNDQLLAHGVPAQARIVQMGPTGVRINGAPQMNLTLEVMPAPEGHRGGNAAPFNATARVLVPIFAMPRIQPGAVVPVRFNPQNPTQLAVDFRAMGFAV